MQQVSCRIFLSYLYSNNYRSLFTAIPFKKRSFKQYFHSEDNWLQFHKLLSRLLRAQSIEIASAIQASIYEWLKASKEEYAATWYLKHWSGERGNYTNASAGYVGNKVANSLEAKWKYYRRDTIGTTGTTQRMPLDIFIPSHIKYVRDLSKKHFSDMVDAAGNVTFPVYPSITTELWKKVQSFDPRIIQLSHVEGGLQYRTAWDESVSAIETCRDTDMNFTSKLKFWHSEGNKMPFPRSLCRGIIMPSKYFIASLENKGFKTLEQLREAVDPIREEYQSMMVNMDEFMTENPHFAKEPEAIMDIMDSF